MKFKLIFIIFNAAILVSFALIFFMPMILLGWEYSRTFWGANWYLPLLFVAIMGILNTYFIVNWKLFTLLEREDWNELVSYLEDRVTNRHRYSSLSIRLLAHGYVVRSDMEGVRRLGSDVKAGNPALFNRHALLFGIPYLLGNKPAEMEEYFREALDAGASDAGWLRWNRAFSLLLLKREDEAKPLLVGLVRSRERDAILILLAAYLLDTFSRRDEEAASEIARVRAALTRKFSKSAWEREIERAKSNLQVVILVKLVQEATDWLYSEGKQESVPK